MPYSLHCILLNPEVLVFQHICRILSLMIYSDSFISSGIFIYSPSRNFSASSDSTASCSHWSSRVHSLKNDSAQFIYVLYGIYCCRSGEPDCSQRVFARIRCDGEPLSIVHTCYYRSRQYCHHIFPDIILTPAHGISSST